MLRQLKQAAIRPPQSPLGDCVAAAALIVIFIVGLHLPVIA